MEIVIYNFYCFYMSKIKKIIEKYNNVIIIYKNYIYKILFIK